MRTIDAIEAMLGDVSGDYDQDACTWNEAVLEALSWVLGHTDEPPRKEP